MGLNFTSPYEPRGHLSLRSLGLMGFVRFPFKDLYLGSYIYISSLLVPKPINVCYFRPFCQSTDGNI